MDDRPKRIDWLSIRRKRAARAVEEAKRPPLPAAVVARGLRAAARLERRWRAQEDKSE